MCCRAAGTSRPAGLHLPPSDSAKTLPVGTQQYCPCPSQVGYRREDVYLHAAPLFHIGGLSSALAMLMAGARHVFLPRFDPAGFLDVVRSVRVTSFIAVPAMVAALVDAAGTGADRGWWGKGPAAGLTSRRQHGFWVSLSGCAEVLNCSGIDQGGKLEREPVLQSHYSTSPPPIPLQDPPALVACAPSCWAAAARRPRYAAACGRSSPTRLCRPPME